MLSEQLSAKKVEHAKPGRYRDGKGLILVVKPSGGKSWVLRVQYDGKRRDYGLGSTDALSLSQAREKAKQGRAWAKQGKDPKVEWAKLELNTPTFEAAAIECHAALKDGWRNAKHSKQWLTTLERYAFPIIGKKPVDEIDVDELKDVLLPIWMEKPETASRVRHRMGAVLSYSKAKKWRSTDAPLNALSFVLPKQKNARKSLYRNHPSLPYEALPEFMGRLRAMDHTVSRLATAFQILTGARTEEIRFARWSEIDVDAGTWSLPDSRMKSGEPHIFYLSSAALLILQDVKELGRISLDDLVFVGSTGGAMSNRAMLKVLHSLDAVDKNGAPAVVHGMRATFRTWAQEKCPTVPESVVELSIAHKQSDKVVAAYARAEFVEMRRALMERWAAYVMGRSDNIVRLAV